ncbi:MAG: response regulator [Rhodanobacter sp.]
MTENNADPLHILVVEDELLIATSLEIALESHGHRLLGPTATVDGALKALETAQPDLALIDYRLADSTTEPLLPVLRERGIPVCVLTGYSRNQLPQAYRHCHVLEKPFRMAALMEALEIMRLHERDGSGG